MIENGIMNLIDNYYSDENFRQQLLDSPDEVIREGNYDLSSEEKEMVKSFITKNWENTDADSTRFGKRLSSENGGCGRWCACTHCGDQSD